MGEQTNSNSENQSPRSPDLIIANSCIVPRDDKISLDNNANPQKILDSLDDETDVDYQCGIGAFKPQWIQKFATKKAFMVVFTLLGVIQGMTWSYFTATISTLEKRFKISSQTAGVCCNPYCILHAI